MSGGFFRGTTADQDTRFSNKHAKLLKSQKFPAELETLVDMTKVKMDVMRPWIAHRVTELLGFEDEVLINFIYGLLEEKVVNGKEIQISLTGFMEKNTGKFMKELWTHLLSAQQNASGVPQQFLDAKEEETRKKQEDMDRITRELKRTKEKESRELEQERMKRTKEKEGWELEEEITKMDREVGNVKAATLEPHSRSHTRVSSTRSADEKGTNESNGSKGMTRISRSPHSADHSLSPPRGRRSRSISKSANSESPSRSRSLSASPKPVRHSVSSEKRRPSLSRRSLTPRRVDSRRRSPSPLSHSYIRSPLPARRRFRSPMRRRSRSPLRRRSRTPIRRRSRTPIRRRSRTPVRRRSRTPIRRRSRTPIRRRPRSPFQYRSPSPFRPRSRSSSSPSRHISRSPMRSRSPPVRRQSRSPIRRRYRRAPSTPPRRRSPSPVRRGAAFSGRRRSPSPGSMSSSPSGRVSLSPKHGAPPSLVRRGSPKRRQGSPMRSPRDGHRIVQKNAPGSPRKVSPERFAEGRKKSSFLVNPPPASVRSSERDPKGRRISHNEEPALSPSPYNSPSSSGSPPPARRSPSVERSPIPPKRQRESMNTNDRLDSVEVEERTFSRGKEDKRENKEPVNDKYDKKKYSPERLASYRSSEIQAHNKKSNDDDGRKHYSEMTEESLRSRDRARNSGKEYKADKMNDLRPNLSQKFQRINNSNRSGSPDSGSEESDEKRKYQRSKRKDAMSDNDYSHDSHSEDKKEAKKRRREEKKLKKEEKRKRREERRRKRDDRRTEKLKLKAVDNYDSDNEDALSDQKKLEIELREKALESLRAKKGIGH